MVELFKVSVEVCLDGPGDLLECLTEALAPGIPHVATEFSCIPYNFLQDYSITSGQLFEALGFLAFLRSSVIGPLSLTVAGQQPNGVRKLETRVPELRRELLATIGAHDSRICAEALLACSEIYKKLRAELAPKGFVRHSAVEGEALRYLEKQLDEENSGD